MIKTLINTLAIWVLIIPFTRALELKLYEK